MVFHLTIYIYSHSLRYIYSTGSNIWYMHKRKIVVIQFLVINNDSQSYVRVARNVEIYHGYKACCVSCVFPVSIFCMSSDKTSVSLHPYLRFSQSLYIVNWDGMHFESNVEGTIMFVMYYHCSPKKLRIIIILILINNNNKINIYIKWFLPV